MSAIRLLLTGGSGFIGTEVATLALQRGMLVKNLDITPPRVEHPNHSWSNVDVRSAIAVDQELLSFRPHLIIHLASDISITLRSLDDYTTTTQGTHNVVRAAGRLAPTPHVLHVSTQFVVKPGRTASSEEDFHPYTLYGSAKAVSETILRSSALDHFTVARPTIIWGPSHPTLADEILKHIATRRYLHPATRTPIKRTYGFVRNTAQQMLALSLNHKTRPAGSVYYLGDCCMNFDSWVDAFAVRITGRTSRRVPKPLLLCLAAAGSGLRSFGLPAPIDLGRYFRMTTSMEYDLARTLAELGPPEVSFTDGVIETVNWLKTRNPRVFGAPSMAGTTPTEVID